MKRRLTVLAAPLFVLAVFALTVVADSGTSLRSASSGFGESGSTAVSATAIAAGHGHSCALITGGGVKCWGSGRAIPFEVPGLSGVAAISAGGGHSCALMSTGGVACWGTNVRGELGDGTTSFRDKPVDVVGLSGAMTAIAAGGEHSCALTSGGGVRCWGYNRWGELGDGTTGDYLTPVAVFTFSGGVSAVAAGGYHSCALMGTGAVECWGDGGTLGDGTPRGRLTPVLVSGLSGVTAIAAGGHHTCALVNTGEVECWGDNSYGQLGDGTTSDRLIPVAVSGLSGVTAIAAGGEHTCALTSTGEVKCWGANFNGELGDRTAHPQEPTPVDVSGLRRGVTALAAGAEHSCALTSTGGVKCWGFNRWGQLGDGTSGNRRFTPVGVIGFGTAAATLAIVVRSVTVTPARVAALKLRCGGEAGCEGRLTLSATVTGRVVGSAARRVDVTLGSSSFLIAAGLTQTVRVGLTLRAFALLARVTPLPTQVRISYEQPSGHTTAATRRIMLERRSR
jgi:alpha-tubulin suppressor-like RCC1 family protein